MISGSNYLCFQTWFMKKKEQIFLFLSLLFYSTFFISSIKPATPFALTILSVFCLAWGPFSAKLRLVKQRPFLLLMVGFALWLLVSAFTSANQHSAGRVLELRLPLLLLPLTLGTLEIRRALRNRILVGAAVITLIACLVSLSFAVYQYNKTGLNFWLYNDSVSYLIGQQSIYTSLLVNMSIFIFAWIIFYSGSFKKYHGWMAFGIAVLLVISYMLASRNMMFVLYAGLFIFCFVYLFGRKKYLEGFTLLLAIGIGGFLIVKFFPNTINRFQELRLTSFDYKNTNRESHYNDSLTADQWNGANFRLAAWPLGWKLFKEHSLTGVGIGDKRDELMAVYREKEFRFAIETNKNVHNNYLDILYSTGLIGFLLFFTGWILLPLIRFIKARDGISIVLTLVAAIAMFTENYFDRTLGSMIFSFLLLILLVADNTRVRHETSEVELQ
ncbi:MAG: O-antigen ligase family protein [Chitinophagaceae bacterium]|nr:MAG: O-antigen ligase family protein [Chitinophagaceae bacterium]